jgi:hypothetical protein
MKKGNINLRISKVKITNLNPSEQPEHQMCGVELGFSEEVTDRNGKLEFVKEHPTVKLRHFLAHEDLCLLFDQVRPHLTMICEFGKPTGVSDYEDASESAQVQIPTITVFVTQVTLTGDADGAGVVITGFKLLSNGMKLALVTPNIMFETGGYMYARELSDLTDEIMAEAMRCLTERRRKVIQTEMFEDEADDETVGESIQDAFGAKVTVKLQAQR